MKRRTWWDEIKEEYPVIEVNLRPYCSAATQDALMKAAQYLRYAILEAKLKPDVRWPHIVHLHYELAHMLAVCDDELAEDIKGKTPEEVYQLMRW